MLARLGAALVALATGCFDASPAVGVRCSSSGACPSGQECDVARDVCVVIGTITELDAPAGDGALDADSIDAPMIDAPIDAPPMTVGPPQFRAFTTVDDGMTTMTVASPAGVVVGDLLLAHVTSDSSTIAQIATPAGWTLITGMDGGNAHCTLAYYRYVANPAASYTWTFPGTNGTIQLMAFRGVHPTSPINASLATTAVETVPPTAPTITTTQANTLLVVLFAQDVSSVALGAIPGMTQVYSQALGQINVLAAYEARAAAGSTGTRTATTTDPGPTTTISVALAPD